MRDFAPPLPAAAPAAGTTFGPFRIPDDVDLLFRGDVAVALEPRAVRLLRYLAAHAGRVVSKRELLEQVWPRLFVTDDVLKQAVAKARRALGPRPNGQAWIETFHARGYRFADPAADDAADRAAYGAPAAPDDMTAVLDALRRAAEDVAALAASLAARTSRWSPPAPSSRAAPPA